MLDRPSEHGTDLRKLHFFNNMQDDGGGIAVARIVEKSPFLEDFRLSSTRCKNAGGAALGVALGAFGNLRRLDLKDNSFGGPGGLALAKALATQGQIEELVLADLSFEDEGGIPILEALVGKAPNLQVLDISCNDMTEEAVEPLCRAVEGKVRLHTLIFDEHEIFSAGAKVLAATLRAGAFPDLKALSFNMCELGNSGALALARCLGGKTAVKGATGVLQLNGNALSESCQEKLGALLESYEAPDALGG